ncbi:hypothetical protein [Sulfurimonas sp.]
MDKYNYEGKVAETLVEVLFKKHGYLVKKFGVENQLDIGLDMFKTTKVKDKSAKESVAKFMAIPDFIVIKVKNEQLKQLYIVEVKYRTFKKYSDFEASIKEGGDIYKQAEKYKELWDGKVHIFLIAKIKENSDKKYDELQTYYGSVNLITDNKYIKSLDKKNYEWLQEEYFEEYKRYVDNFYRSK